MTPFSESPADCGPRLAASRAQRAISIVLILALLITSLVGCSSSSNQDVAQAAAGGMDAADVAAAPVDAAPPAADASAGGSAPQEAAAEQSGQENTASDASVAAPADAATDAPALDGLLPLSRTTNILVLGSDRRPDTPNWRTDVMMIVALDYENNRAGVISIPRDIFIERIPNHNPNKINVVDYLGEQDEPDGGGPKLLSDIIQEKMGVPIHHFVRFDFTGFVDLVDALGGVEIEIDCPYYDYFQIEDVVLNVKPGVQRLTGEEALVYVRSRRLGGDLDRARRQQRFIWAIRNQVLNENILTKLPALYNALSDSVQTDMGIVQTLRVARFALGLEKEHITGFVIGYPLVRQGYAGSMWVFFADWPAIADEAQHVFERDPFIDTNTLDQCP